VAVVATGFVPGIMMRVLTANESASGEHTRAFIYSARYINMATDVEFDSTSPKYVPAYTNYVDTYPNPAAPVSTEKYWASLEQARYDVRVHEPLRPAPLSRARTSIEGKRTWVEGFLIRLVVCRYRCQRATGRASACCRRCVLNKSDWMDFCMGLFFFSFFSRVFVLCRLATCIWLLRVHAGFNAAIQSDLHGLPIPRTLRGCWTGFDNQHCEGSSPLTG
jgi:hypothetical protein